MFVTRLFCWYFKTLQKHFNEKKINSTIFKVVEIDEACQPCHNFHFSDHLIKKKKLRLDRNYNIIPFTNTKDSIHENLIGQFVW